MFLAYELCLQHATMDSKREHYILAICTIHNVTKNIPFGEGSWLLDSMFLEEIKHIFRKEHMTVLRQWSKQRGLSNKEHSGT